MRLWKLGGDVQEVVLPRTRRAGEAVQSHTLGKCEPVLQPWLGVSESRVLGEEVHHSVAPLTL